VKQIICMVVLASMSGLSVKASEMPSVEEMWRIIQQQQAQIDRLEEAMASRDNAPMDRSSLTRRIEQTELQLEATANAVEQVMSDSAGSGGVDIAGYGELHYNNLDSGEEIDFHRFVMYFGHEFRDNLRFFSELEVEHSIAGDGKVGEVELEQAFVQWDYADSHRAQIGLFLLPVGILNETHEPDTFYGVERNDVEKNIIPATWWEGGFGLSGEIAPGWGYDVAVHSGLRLDTDNASGSKRTSIRSGRQKVGKADADSLAYTARLRYAGVPGFQWSAAVQRQTDLAQGDADGIGIGSIGATLLETDVTFERGMFNLRALYARWSIDDEIEALSPGADEQSGWYIEPSWKFSKQLGVFARYGTYDLSAGDSTASNEKTRLDFGFNYWMHENVVIKADYTRQDDDQGNDTDGFNIGFGYSF
jgi:hypothetical protein